MFELRFVEKDEMINATEARKVRILQYRERDYYLKWQAAVHIGSAGWGEWKDVPLAVQEDIDAAQCHADELAGQGADLSQITSDVEEFDDLTVAALEPGRINHHHFSVTNFERVRKWMATFGQDTPCFPAFPSREVLDLRDSLINEEFCVEYREAVRNNDLIETADALADILVVVYGTAVALGIDIDMIFNEVMDSNDSKAGEDGKPIFREDGKVLKGPNYFKPDIAKLLRRQAEIGMQPQAGPTEHDTMLDKQFDENTDGRNT